MSTMGIIFGLLAALGWGTSDFFARYLTRSVGAYRTTFYIQFLGIGVLGAYLLLSGELLAVFSRNAWQAWAWMALAVLLNVISALVFMHALEVGKLMLVTPITASYAAITVALSLLSGEVLTLLHALAIGLVLLGVIVTSIMPGQARGDEQEPPPLRRHVVPLLDEFYGVGWALIAALSYGVTFWLQGTFVVPDLGAITPVWLVRLFTPVLLLLGAPLFRQSLKLPRRSDWWLILSMSFADTLAYVLFSLGSAQGDIGIITMLSSLYSVVTILLAGIILRERLLISQWIGVGIVFGGIILVNL
jgi:drug/metabolite transporter (DMT)-like permease